MAEPRTYELDRRAPQRWEQVALDHHLRAIATGEWTLSTEEADRVIPQNRRRGHGGGQNLTATGAVAACLSGLTPPEEIAALYRARLPGGEVGMSRFELASAGYFPGLQLLPALNTVLRIPAAAGHALRWLRAILTWYAIHTTDDGEVVAPTGRIYRPPPGEEPGAPVLSYVIRPVLGLPQRATAGRRAWRGSYGAQVWAVEGRPLVEAIFSPAELEALAEWRRTKALRPGLATILGDLRPPPDEPGTEWRMLAGPGGFASWWNKTRSYIDGDNGVVPAVVLDGLRIGRIWTDSHTDTALVIGTGRLRLDIHDHREGRTRTMEVPSGQTVELALTTDGLQVHPGGRHAGGVPLPALPKWVPRMPGIAGGGQGAPPPPEDEPEEEEEEPVPHFAIDPASLTARDWNAIKSAPDKRTFLQASAVTAQDGHPRMLAAWRRVEPLILAAREKRGEA
jgi:hypothetical protein